MGDKKIISDAKYSVDVAGKKTQVTGQELDVMLAKDTAGLITEYSPIESYYRSPDGGVVKEGLTAEQLRRRKSMGEENVNLGAGDPKVDAWRRDEARRGRQAIAGDMSVYAGMRNFIPFIQEMENAAVGKRAATRARQEIISASPISHQVGLISSFVVGGIATQSALRATKFGSVIAGHRASWWGKTGQLVGEDVALSTYLHAQHLRNNGQEFIAEDWAEAVGEGLVFAATPLAFFGAKAAVAGAYKAYGASALSTGVSAAGGAASGIFKGAAGAASMAANMKVFKGLGQTGAMAGKTMRQSSQFRLGSRIARTLHNRLFRKGGRAGSNVSSADDIAIKQKILDKELREIEGFTPESFVSKKSGISRGRRIERLRELGGQVFDELDEINFGEMGRSIKAMGTQVRGIAKTLHNINLKIRNPKSAGVTAKKPPRARSGVDPATGKLYPREAAPFKNIDEGLYDIEVRAAYDELVEAGYGDIAAHLENTFHLSDAKESMGKWLQVRMAARFRGKGKPWETVTGSRKADGIAKKFLQNRRVWGDEATVASELNTAIDKITDAWDVIDNTVLTDAYDVITAKDVNLIARVESAVGDVRAGYNVLRKHGVLSGKEVDALEHQLTITQKAVGKGREGYLDAIKINKARDAAKAGNDASKAELKNRTPKTPEEIDGLMEESAVEGAVNLQSLKGLANEIIERAGTTTGPLLGTRGYVYGVVALKQSSTAEERRALYDEIATNITNFASNPEALAAHMADATASIMGADSDAGLAVQSKMAQTMYYLASEMPKPDSSYTGSSIPLPMSRVDTFLDKAIAAFDPMSVGVLSLTGRITPGMVNAVRNTSPAQYAEMTNIFAEVLDELDVEKRRKAPKATISGISMFLGGLNPAHVGMALVAQQSNYAQTQAEQQVIGNTNNTMKSPGPQTPGSDYTSTQRVTGF